MVNWQWSIGNDCPYVALCLLSIACCLLKKGQSANVKECAADFLGKWDK